MRKCHSVELNFQAESKSDQDTNDLVKTEQTIYRNEINEPQY